MVNRFYVKCLNCEKLYQIKIQLDRNIYIYDWPIRFNCIDCGDDLIYNYGEKGFLQKTCNFQPSPDDSPITTISYSSSLPITDEGFMKDMNYIDSMVNFSPYMNLCKGHFSLVEVQEFDLFLERLQDNFLPYRCSMIDLYPILVKGNFRAFGNKMAKIFGMKKHKDLEDASEMHNLYFELLEKSYRNLCTDKYDSNYRDKYIQPLQDYLNKATKVDLTNIKKVLDRSGYISEWYKDIALQYVVELLADIHKFIPVMIYPNSGVSDISTRGNLNILTISYNSALGYYKKGFEIFYKGLRIIVGLTNIVENGSIDIFNNAAAKGISDINKFSSLSAGKMIDVLKNYKSLDAYLDGSFNNHVRNAATHAGIDYNPETQAIICYYDPKDHSKVYNTTLMEVSRMCFIQLLHIIETLFLAKEIVYRARLKT